MEGLSFSRSTYWIYIIVNITFAQKYTYTQSH